MASESDDRTLYIGNLDKNVTEEILYELFLQAGPIERVNIPYSNGDSYRYGFVTYKHDCSVDYAVDLYKGTNLFRKELSIKRKGVRNGNNSMQTNDFNKHSSDQNRQSINFPKLDQGLLQTFQQNFLQNVNCNLSSLNNFTSNLLKGSWSSGNKPYDRGPRNHQFRHREFRDRQHSYRGNKMYHGRKNRHRD